MSQKDWFFYVLSCSDKSLYAGVTTDVDRRIAQHNEGKGSKYVRSRLPATLLYKRKMKSKRKAFSLEKRFKLLSRADKLKKLVEFVNEDHGFV